MEVERVKRELASERANNRILTREVEKTKIDMSNLSSHNEQLVTRYEQLEFSVGQAHGQIMGADAGNLWHAMEQRDLPLSQQVMALQQ